MGCQRSPSPGTSPNSAGTEPPSSAYELRLALRSRRDSAGRADDDVPLGLLALGAGGHALDEIDRVVHDLPICGRHRLQCPFRACRQDLLGDLLAEPLQGSRTALTVVSDVDQDSVRLGGEAALDDCSRHVLQRGQRRPARSYQESQLLAVGCNLDGVLVADTGRHRRPQAVAVQQALEELAGNLRLLLQAHAFSHHSHLSLGCRTPDSRLQPAGRLHVVAPRRRRWQGRSRPLCTCWRGAARRGLRTSAAAASSRAAPAAPRARWLICRATLGLGTGLDPGAHPALPGLGTWPAGAPRGRLPPAAAAPCRLPTLARTAGPLRTGTGRPDPGADSSLTPNPSEQPCLRL